MTENVSGRTLDFFASRTDLINLTEPVTSIGLTFVETEPWLENQFPSTKSFRDIIQGIPEQREVADYSPIGYLVSRYGADLQARAIRAPGGGQRYVYDQMVNERTLLLGLGLPEGHDFLLPSRLSTIWSDSESKLIFAALSKVLRKVCTRVRSFWVAPEALRLLRAGVRLTGNPVSSQAYDLSED